MSGNYEIKPETCDMAPAPDWTRRPWGRPTVHQANSDMNTKLVGVVEFKYHGIRVRGVRIYRNDNGTLSVTMPQKRFGETIESVLYFHDAGEREQFNRDVIWLFWSVFGRRLQNRVNAAAADAAPVATAV